jgi:hypothetical protein
MFDSKGKDYTFQVLQTTVGSWKGLPRTNATTYYEHLQITDVKSFIVMGLAGNENFVGF